MYTSFVLILSQCSDCFVCFKSFFRRVIGFVDIDKRVFAFSVLFLFLFLCSLHNFIESTFLFARHSLPTNFERSMRFGWWLLLLTVVDVAVIVDVVDV